MPLLGLFDIFEELFFADENDYFGNPNEIYQRDSNVSFNHRGFNLFGQKAIKPFRRGDYKADGPNQPSDILK